MSQPDVYIYIYIYSEEGEVGQAFFTLSGYNFKTFLSRVSFVLQMTVLVKAYATSLILFAHTDPSSVASSAFESINASAPYSNTRHHILRTIMSYALLKNPLADW